jgi:N-acetylmuramic acid 6-phosphate etherase
MAKMGRVWGNWMVQVLPTNKKLIDRSTRIISFVSGLPYEKANEEFFYSFYNRKPEDEYRESYVIETLKRLGFEQKDRIE